MHVLCTGAAGMIGRKLTARLSKDGAVGGRAISCLTLTDIVAPPQPALGGAEIITTAADLPCSARRSRPWPAGPT
jgi:D-erythronate 2-dehydrogenase